ncbi:MAG: hypothetical protein ACR2MK_05875 [Solirubrobacteraceae bacterium]
MASLRKKAKAAVPFSAADLANITKTNPYIQRLIDDPELRDNVRTALDSSKSAYGRLANGKAPHRALVEDKKLQKDLRDLAEAVREVTVSLNEAPSKRARKTKRKGGLGRKLLLVLIGAAVALAVSEKLRSKVLDTLFGAEEEFQYTPPPASSTTPPATPVTAA